MALLLEMFIQRYLEGIIRIDFETELMPAVIFENLDYNEKPIDEEKNKHKW